MSKCEECKFEKQEWTLAPCNTCSHASDKMVGIKDNFEPKQPEILTVSQSWEKEKTQNLEY